MEVENSMYNKRADVLYLMLAGIIAMVIGILILNMSVATLSWLFSFVGYALVGMGILQIFRYFLVVLRKQDQDNHLMTISINLIIGVIILSFPKMPVSLFGVIVGLYALILGLSHVISYYLLHKNAVKGKLIEIILAVMYLGFGIFLLFSPYLRMDVVLTITGIYFILYGFTYLKDMMQAILPIRYKNNVKRKIRITLPVFVEALIPRFVLDEINNFLQPKDDEENMVEGLPEYVESKGDEDANLEVFVHTSPKGFGAVGHVDICYQGKVISYGNYDNNSHRFFEMVGDGVLFYADRESYIPFVIGDSNKTLISFGIHLDEQQLKQVENKIMLIESNLYRWTPPIYEGKDDMYATRLDYYVNTVFYKFKESKFKSYYVLGTNCVLLADQILGSAGIDVLKMSGIITPGTYYEYLNKEFASKRMFVISKEIYN